MTTRRRRLHQRRPAPARPIDPLAAEIADVERRWRDAQFARHWFASRDPARAAAAAAEHDRLEQRRRELVAERERRDAASRARAAQPVADLDHWSRGGTRS